MSVFHVEKTMHYTAYQISTIIFDVASYPQFLPWCKQANIVQKFSPQHFHAELAVAFHHILQKYTSNVVLTQHNTHHFVIEANAIKGPFQKLHSKWEIKNLGNNCCIVNFFLDFAFNSFLLNKTIGLVFASASQKMINAFEKRATQLYSHKLS
jgi:coenzyme Q-binding protein COQ10